MEVTLLFSKEKQSRPSWEHREREVVATAAAVKNWGYGGCLGKKRNDAAGLYGKPFPHYYTLGEIYGRDRATGINAGNADDDEEEVHQQDTMNVNLGDDSNMAFEENSIENEMSYTQQPSVQPNQPLESSPNVSTHKEKTRSKNKDKAFENMCSNIGLMAQFVAAMVPKLNGLIDMLSTVNKDVAGLQANLYEEIMKSEGLDDDQLYDVTNILATNNDMLRVFYNIPNQLKIVYILKVLSHGA
ncbi:hypothetical protein TIFTF001_034563 [Ficus carica]|uniref:Uncharacterized protein n=1 Tax=Ficus carica TaxID=3494 RepID=A0AA88E1J6_FICCA|nr:hypothetical protein TIFTF001_034563 [Ficus carica]